jgi:hypothetical protein
MADTVTKAEATLIAQDAAKTALHEHQASLPQMLKPVMYEVAENVARRGQKDLQHLLTAVFGADVANQEHLRDLHKDLYWLRDNRVAHDERKKIARQELLRSAFKLMGTCALAAIAAICAVVGLKVGDFPGGR